MFKKIDIIQGAVSLHQFLIFILFNDLLVYTSPFMSKSQVPKELSFMFSLNVLLYTRILPTFMEDLWN